MWAYACNYSACLLFDYFLFFFRLSFCPATPPAVFVVHEQKIHQNVRLGREWCAVTFLRHLPNGWVRRGQKQHTFNELEQEWSRTDFQLLFVWLNKLAQSLSQPGSCYKHAAFINVSLSRQQTLINTFTFKSWFLWPPLTVWCSRSGSGIRPQREARARRLLPGCCSSSNSRGTARSPKAPGARPGSGRSPVSRDMPHLNPLIHKLCKPILIHNMGQKWPVFISCVISCLDVSWL